MMPRGLRRLLSVFIAVAFLGGTIGVGVAFAGEACDHAAGTTDRPANEKHHHHDDADAVCLACPCCAVVPTLPDAAAVPKAPSRIVFVIYAEASPRLSGRTLVPDPSPPRPVA